MPSPARGAGAFNCRSSLIDNAFKFSRDSRPPTLNISATPTEKSVTLAIQDNGICYDMQFHDRIFDIFQRLQRAKDYPCTRGGQAVVRKAARRMGGRVRTGSLPRRGSHLLPGTAAMRRDPNDRPILLDLKLPRVDGLEILRRQREHPVSHDLPVVVLTSSRKSGDVETACRHHANSCIVKPVNFEKFMEVAAQIELYWCLLNHPPR